MAAPRKFATLTADVLGQSMRRAVTPEMERSANLQLREVVKKVWWVMQPYRSFGESRATIRRTENTMRYIRGLPADSTQRATTAALRARDLAQAARNTAHAAWRVYATYPLTFCGSLLGAYGTVSIIAAPKRRP